MPLPNFLIIGANKSGTSSLHVYLNQHPEIYMSAVKEPTYFASIGRDKAPSTDAEQRTMESAVTTLAAYQALFDDAGDCLVRGESSTAYLANPHFAEIIQRTLPSVKLLAILRHPVERAFSNYRMYRRWGYETRSFSRAIREELKGKCGHLPQGQRYLSLGFYAAQLSSYMRMFGPDRLRIYFFERLRSDPAELLKEICGYLGVDDTFGFHTDTKWNADLATIPSGGWLSRFRGGDRLKPKDAVLLQEYFYDDMRNLTNVLGVSTGDWLNRYKR